MSTELTVTSNRAPNHAARYLFLSLLDQEWPELKLGLIQYVWPTYRKLWRPASPPYDPETTYSDDRRFIATRALEHWDWFHRSPDCELLKDAMTAWAAGTGIDVINSWFLDCALASLSHFSPAIETPDSKKFDWVPGYLIDDTFGLPLFEPRFENALWVPSDESWELFAQRISNEVNRLLTIYRKEVQSRWLAHKGNHTNYAKWTIARFSGLSWNAIVERFAIIYQGSPQFKVSEKVAEFSREIGLTLGETLGTKDKKPSRNRHKAAIG